MDINSQSYQAIVNGHKDAPVDQLTLEQRLQVEQVRLLKAINGKLNFFAVLVILSIVLGFLFNL